MRLARGTDDTMLSLPSHFPLTSAPKSVREGEKEGGKKKRKKRNSEEHVCGLTLICPLNPHLLSVTPRHVRALGAH